MAKHWDMTVLTWGALSGGILTGKYTADSNEPTRYDIEELPEETQTIIAEVQDVADEVGKTASQVAINWVRQQQQWAQIIPIVGARTLAQLEDNLGVLDWQLSAEQLARLDETSALDHGFPLGWLPGAADIIYGQTLDQIDNHRTSYPPVR